MRRSRIKAVATVPVRRKATQDGSAVAPAAQTDAKVSEKPSEEKVESKTESSPIAVEQKETEKISIPAHTEKIPVSPVEKEKDCSEPKFPEVVKEPEPTNDVQPVSKLNSAQKPATPSVEGPPIKTVSKLDSPQKPATPSVEGSPIKTLQGRSCFMRPTPRLDGGCRIRRNSIQGSGASASESEDDSKRSHSIPPSRVRNDSICSVQSLKDSGDVSNNAKLNLDKKRRMVFSESARKLAEARREFFLKNENKPPDKSKLTMYDLIYYNPTSNPMKPKPVTRPAARKISVCSVPDKTRDEEETVDEPEEMLVPQVKVGPNGQLIIDEQSLVIDQYKAQENIDRSDIMVDEDTTGNGFYKRRKKSKDWNKWETVKFYKALNTYGTDFLLMQSIFPKRTRQELKLKYKKEERLNRNLVEKALEYQEFDTDALKEDLANVEESERKESEMKKPKKRRISSSKKTKRKRCQMMTNEIDCENDELNADTNKSSGDELSSDENVRITITKNKKIRKRPTRKRKMPKIEESSADENAKVNSDSEPEVYKAQTTRSGRAPKKTKKSPKKSVKITNKKKTAKIVKVGDKKNNNGKEKEKEITVNDPQKSVTNEISTNSDIIEDMAMSNENVENTEDQVVETQNIEKTENQNDLLEKLGANAAVAPNVFDGITDDIPNMTNLKPGSLVVLKKDSVDIPGKTYLQVYIVSSDYDAKNPNCKDSLLPIDLSPDILETVTNCIKDIEPQNIS